MTDDREAQQEREWEILHDRIDNFLRSFGRKHPTREGDYWLVDDNLGLHQQGVEIQNLELLAPPVIEGLQRLIADYPDWEIVISIDVPGTEKTWPRMGLVVQVDKIIDGLQRHYLPEPFRNLHYQGSQPYFDPVMGRR
jgi:hypothetical protein